MADYDGRWVGPPSWPWFKRLLRDLFRVTHGEGRHDV